MNQNKWGHGGLNPWPHHVKNHENKEVKRNVVKGIRTMVLARKCNLKEKKEIRGVGFEPTTSQSDLRKSKRKLKIKCEAWESNPWPLGSEGE